MNKDILIEVFKHKACNGGKPEFYKEGSFSFQHNDGGLLGKTVYIEIDKCKEKYYILFGTISEEITEEEFKELKSIFDSAKKEAQKIEEEKKKSEYIKECDIINNLYKDSVKQKRKILIEKNDK